MTTDTRTTTFPDGTPFLNEGRLLKAIEAYLEPEDATAVANVLRFLHEVSERRGAMDADHNDAGEIEDLEHALSEAVSTAQTLAESLRIDAVTLVAVLIYPLLESGAVALADVRERVGATFGDQVARTIESLARFDSTQRSGANLRRTALTGTENAEADRERKRSRERRKRQDADGLRRMFLSVAEDPRVVIIKIADQLRLMRAVRKAADRWRAHTGQPTSQAGKIEDSGPQVAIFTPPVWTLDECLLLAEETREVYAPLAARLGMGRVEGELEDVAFAVLEPEEYHWLSEAVEEETQERRGYVERVCATLREEMRAIGIEAEVSGRVKHLYSIYRKVKRSGSRDLTGMFDILAFRIIVNTVAECYQALGHVHELWRPKDGRIKDFIAAPKPNGYQSLHTTVFCLDDRLAEIQIRTREMHELAEYGVAMHWYYKDVGDTASAKAKPLQAWMQQVQEWQQELRSPGTAGAQRALEAVKGDVLKEQIFVFTPAGDVKELPAGSTPLDFAYRIHSELGNHVAGARVTSDDGTGRLVKRMVPLDYELHGGDVVDIMRRNDAHPTRDWLRFARTKAARQHITRYLKEHERDIDLQIGRERLDRELRLIGLRKGVEDVADDDLRWLAGEFHQPNPEALLVALARDSVRISALLAKVRERLKIPTQAELAAEAPAPSAAPREEETGASVAGMAGLLTRLGACCNPLPGDDIVGFVTRGRGVVIHRATCPNLRTLAAREPERVIAVAWPKASGAEGAQMLRAHVIVEGSDRTGLLRDVTGVITNRKINMVKVETVTKKRPSAAVIDAVLEIQRPEDLESVLRELREVPGVTRAERKEPHVRKREQHEKREKSRR